MFLDMTQLNEEELTLANGNAWLTIEDWNFMGGNIVGVDSYPPGTLNGSDSNSNSTTNSNNNSSSSNQSNSSSSNSSNGGWSDVGASKP